MATFFNNGIAAAFLNVLSPFFTAIINNGAQPLANMVRIRRLTIHLCGLLSEVPYPQGSAPIVCLSLLLQAETEQSANILLASRNNSQRSYSHCRARGASYTGTRGVNAICPAHLRCTR